MCIRDRIDTQGMSGPVDPAYRGKDNIYPRDEKGNPIYPPANFKVWPIFDDKERAELKEFKKNFEMVELDGGSWKIDVPRRKR